LTKLGYPPEKMRVIYNSVASSAPTERAGRYVRVLQEEFLALLITTGGWAKREESAIAPASVSSGWLRSTLARSKRLWASRCVNLEAGRHLLQKRGRLA
jgi:hypothetical protein